MKKAKPLLCQHCGKKADFRGIQEHHLHGGWGRRKFSLKEYWCAPCHFGPDGHRTEGVKRDDLPDGPTFTLSGCHGTTGRPITKAAQTGRRKHGE